MKKLFLSAALVLGVAGLSTAAYAQQATTVKNQTIVTDKKDVGSADLSDKKDVGSADLN